MEEITSAHSERIGKYACSAFIFLYVLSGSEIVYVGLSFVLNKWNYLLPMSFVNLAASLYATYQFHDFD